MIELRVPARLEYRDLVTRAVATGCKVGVGDSASSEQLTDLLNAMVSVVGEAFNNVVEHAYAGRDGGEVTITIAPVDGMFEMTMTDSGVPFAFDDAPEPDLDALPESGMGIFIMRAMADEVTYRAGPPNVLVVKKRL
jgi:anti-sigma regulatory factor (Ser/Thr protein kinase)